MADARTFGPVAEQMSAALERYSKEELIDLLTHIVKTYVVEGTLPLKPEVGTSSGEDHLASLSFPQLILHHQMRLDHREWQLFSVSGEDVWVSFGGQRINLTERPSSLPPAPERAEGYMEPLGGAPRRQAPAAAAEGAARPAAPAAPAQAAPAAPEPAPGKPPASPAPAAEQGATPQRNDGIVTQDVGDRAQVPDSEDIEASERFGMLEFD